MCVCQEQMEEMKRKEERLEKDLAEVLLQNRHLTEPLQRAKEEVAELQKQLANYEKDKTSLAVGYTHKHRIEYMISGYMVIIQKIYSKK